LWSPFGANGLLSLAGAYAVPVDIQLELEGDEPRAVWFGRRRVPVHAVLDRWYAPGMLWWKVATDEGPYILRRALPDGLWELAAVPRS